MLIVDLSGTALSFAYTRVVSQIDGAVRAHAHAHDDHYLTHSKFNSHRNYHPTNIYIHPCK